LATGSSGSGSDRPGERARSPLHPGRRAGRPDPTGRRQRTARCVRTNGPATRRGGRRDTANNRPRAARFPSWAATASAFRRARSTPPPSPVASTMFISQQVATEPVNSIGSACSPPRTRPPV